MARLLHVTFSINSDKIIVQILVLLILWFSIVKSISTSIKYRILVYHLLPSNQNSNFKYHGTFYKSKLKQLSGVH